MITKSSARVRFAPSPTGELHLGSARTALYDYLFARHHGGKFVLRIEDTDQARYVQGAMDRFLDDLRWLGLHWDEGPDIGGAFGPYIQSERTELYEQAAQELLAKGYAYKCWCTPERLKEMRDTQVKAKQPSKYDRHCLRSQKSEVRSQNERFVIRLKVPEGKTRFNDLIRGEVVVQNKEIDDSVLLKSDGLPTYHLASVVDDHAMAITHVLRTEEWLPSTPKHLLLYQAFGWQPPKFAHLPLVLNRNKQKMSKRKDGELVWVGTYRKQGYLPEALVNYLLLLGWNPGTEQEFFNPKEMLAAFSLDRVHQAGAIFDEEKLKYMNAHYLRELDNSAIAKQLKSGNFLSPKLNELSNQILENWIQITRDRMQTLGEFKALVEPILNLHDYPAELLIFKKSDILRTKKGLDTLYLILNTTQVSTWDSIDSLQAELERAVTDGLTNGDVFWPARAALSGLEASPSPAELLWAFGKDESLKRLTLALKKLSNVNQIIL